MKNLYINNDFTEAIIHRDYASSSQIELRIYDRKITLWNHGSLPEPLKIEMLTTKHASYPRNKRIADIFFRAGYIESWGRGIQTIIDEVQQNGLPEPKFSNFSMGIEVTFERQIDYSANVFEKDTEKGPEKGPGKVTANQQLILDNMEQNPYITREELVLIVGIALSKIKENISKLKAKGLLERVGPDKGGHWKVNQIIN